jgi:hypothetical protein
MTFNYYLPPKTYAFLVKLAEEYRLSTKEVQRVLINEQAAKLGFECNHERVGFAKSDKKPYCKDCWARLRVETREPYRIGTRLVKETKYVERETFLDEFYGETAKENLYTNDLAKGIIENKNTNPAD